MKSEQYEKGLGWTAKMIFAVPKMIFALRGLTGLLVCLYDDLASFVWPTHDPAGSSDRSAPTYPGVESFFSSESAIIVADGVEGRARLIFAIPALRGQP